MGMFKPIKYAEKDCTIDSLPHSRVQAFFDILKYQWRKVLICSLILFACSLPLIVVFYIEIKGIAYYVSQFLKEEIDRETYLNGVFPVINYSNLFLILGFALFAFSIGVVHRVYVKLCWQKGILFQDELKEGLKQNTLQNVIVSVIFAILFFLAGLVYGVSFIAESTLMVLVVIFYVVVIFIFLPIMFIFFEMNAVYKDNFKTKLKNSALIYSRTFPFAILCIVIFLAPLGLLFIGTDLAILITLGCYFLIYFPLAFLGLNLFMMKIFDKYINARFYPEIVDLGIWRK